MFITRWFEASGIDRIMAPIDEDGPPVVVEADSSNDAEGDFWEFVAPRHPPSAAAAQDARPVAIGSGGSGAGGNDETESGGGALSGLMDIVSHRTAQPTTNANANNAASLSCGRMVVCQHCSQLTPVDGPSSTTTTISDNASETHLMTPGARHPKTPYNTPAANGGIVNNENNDDDLELERDSMFRTNEILTEQSFLWRQVLEANSETAVTFTGQSSEWENVHKLFEAAGAAPKPPKKGRDGKIIPPKLDENGKPVMSKNLKKVVNILRRRPGMVLKRTGGMETSLGLPDGYTVLHAACHAGNPEVLGYLLENHVYNTGEAEEEGNVPKLDLNVVTSLGRTALHVAAERGNVEVLPLLSRAYERLGERENRLMMQEEEEESASSDDSDDEACQAVVESGGTAIRADGDGKGTDETAEGLAEEMAKLSTSDSKQKGNDTTTATSPVPRAKKSPKRNKSSRKSSGRSPKPRRSSRSPMAGMRTPKTPVSKSPIPPSSAHGRSPRRSPMRRSGLSPTFAGSRAPVDMAGRSPLGYAATSPVPKAKKNRSELERMLYKKGDPSVVGTGGRADKTPPTERCGPRRGGFLSPNAARTPASGRRTVGSYLSPNLGRFGTPGSVATSRFDTPFSSPPTIHEEVRHGNDDKAGLRYGFSEVNGWRIDMEDKILDKGELYANGESPPPRPSSLIDAEGDETAIVPTVSLFGVFDGHGDGGFASNFVATNLWSSLQRQPDWPMAYHTCNHTGEHMESALTQAFYDIDEDLRKDTSKPSDGGTTAIVVLVSDAKIYVPNVGDSRCILVRRRVADDGGPHVWDMTDLEVVAMSEDHKPDLPEERARIESAGLSVQTDMVPPDENDPDGEYTTVHRVKKSDREMLGVSRAFGDYDYKSNADLSASRQAVVCTPDIVVRERSDGEDMYLVLACDGIWDVMSNDDAGSFVARRVAERMGWDDSVEGSEVDDTERGDVLARVGDDLLEECLDRGSRDNMSVLIVALPASGLLSSSSVSATSAVDAGAVPAVADGIPVRALAYE